MLPAQRVVQEVQVWLLYRHLRSASGPFFSEIMPMPLHDHPCYGVVRCPFGLTAGMHAEAAWNTLSVADLSVGGGRGTACRCRHKRLLVNSRLDPRPRTIRAKNMFYAWSLIIY